MGNKIIFSILVAFLLVGCVPFERSRSLKMTIDCLSNSISIDAIEFQVLHVQVYEFEREGSELFRFSNKEASKRGILKLNKLQNEINSSKSLCSVMYSKNKLLLTATLFEESSNGNPSDTFEFHALVKNFNVNKKITIRSKTKPFP